MMKVAEVKAGARYTAGWYGFMAKYYARETWQALPGPWYVKVLLVGVCTLIPGCGDELLLIAVTAWARKRAAKKRAVEVSA